MSKESIKQELQSGPKNKFPEIVYVLIEVAKESKNKYELDKKTGLLFLDRDLFGTMTYPADYGMIPQTLCDDGDAVDALVLTSQPHQPGTVIPARPIALMQMSDEKGIDNKVLCVPDDKVSPDFKEIKDLKDVPSHILEKIKNFFKHYKDLEPGKWVKIEKWQDKKTAKEFIVNSAKSYQKNNLIKIKN